MARGNVEARARELEKQLNTLAGDVRPVVAQRMRLKRVPRLNFVRASKSLDQTTGLSQLAEELEEEKRARRRAQQRALAEALAEQQREK